MIVGVKHLPPKYLRLTQNLYGQRLRPVPRLAPEKPNNIKGFGIVVEAGRSLPQIELSIRSKIVVENASPLQILWHDRFFGQVRFCQGQMLSATHTRRERERAFFRHVYLG
jgi:hypothetical protein